MLTIELVPSTSWYSNVRSNVSNKIWKIIKLKAAENAGHVCEECGDSGLKQGRKHAVECHEIWEYDDNTYKQKLIGFVALCPKCHSVKHIGRAFALGFGNAAIKHLCKVNKMSSTEAENYVHTSLALWQERSKHEWDIDISYIKTYLNG